MEKSLEFLPSDKNGGFVINFLLVLLRLEQGLVPEETSGKWYTVLSFGTGNGKIILTLLAEVLALHV